MADTENQGFRQCLSKLRARLSAVYWFNRLYQNFPGAVWEDVTEEFQGFVDGFINRVDDISSLGNLSSVENRFVKLHYLGREQRLCRDLLIPPPCNLKAKNTYSGALLCWQGSGKHVDRWRIFRGDEIIGETVAECMHFEDLYNGRTEYRVLAVADGREGMPSPPVPCLAGEADYDRVRVLSISAPTRAEAGKSVDFSAILLDNTSAEYLTAFLYWRIPGRDIWNCLQMERREKSIFGIRLPGKNVSAGGLEYYIKGSDPSTGSWEQLYTVTVPILQQEGSPAHPSIRLTANDTVKWTVKTLEGKKPDWAQVSRDGIFSAWGEGLVRVTAVSEDGKRYGERVIVCGVIR